MAGKRFLLLCAVFVALALAAGATLTLSQGPVPSDNPNYLPPNPMYFEGKITWDLLRIDQPKNPWEFMQRGLHRQDDLDDIKGAIEDYKEAIKEPSLIIARTRLGVLLRHENPQEATRLFREVLEIDPERLEINFLIGETFAEMGQYEEALKAFRAELELSPVTELSRRLTGDEANNAHTHFEMGEIYEKLKMYKEAIQSFENYLKATRWHSDIYPWRIPLVKKRIEELQRKVESL